MSTNIILRHITTGNTGTFMREYKPTGKPLTTQILMSDRRIYYAPSIEFTLIRRTMKTAEDFLNDFDNPRNYNASDKHPVIKLMEAYKDQFTPKWISTTEHLPEHNVEVLVCHNNDPFTHGVAALEEHEGELRWNNRDVDCDLENYNLWMPIPPKNV